MKLSRSRVDGGAGPFNPLSPPREDAHVNQMPHAFQPEPMAFIRRDIAHDRLERLGCGFSGAGRATAEGRAHD
jgi:hypothetical protein